MARNQGPPRQIPASTAIGRRKHRRGQVARLRGGSSGFKVNRITKKDIGEGDMVEIRVTQIDYSTSIPVIV